MTRYAAGRRKEWAARDYLKKRGALLVIRSAGSKSLVDLVAVYPEVTCLVQVKYVARGASWKDKNWKRLCALDIREGSIWRMAVIYRRGILTPELITTPRGDA